MKEVLLERCQREAREYLGTSPTQLNGTDYLADNIPVQKLDNLIANTLTDAQKILLGEDNE
jgi:hypothetical protein